MYNLRCPELSRAHHITKRHTRNIEFTGTSIEPGIQATCDFVWQMVESPQIYCT